MKWMDVELTIVQFKKIVERIFIWIALILKKTKLPELRSLEALLYIKST